MRLESFPGSLLWVPLVLPVSWLEGPRKDPNSKVGSLSSPGPLTKSTLLDKTLFIDIHDLPIIRKEVSSTLRQDQDIGLAAAHKKAKRLDIVNDFLEGGRKEFCQAHQQFFNNSNQSNQE